MDAPRTLAYAGIDWGTEAHEVCVLDGPGEELGRRTVPHSAVGLDELCAWLSEFGAGVPAAVHVGIEVPHGAVVETLVERGFVVHSINPKQLDRFRDRFSVAGAKDDRLDALVLASSLRTDPHRYRRVEIADPVFIELREWSRMHAEFTQDRRRFANRMREQIRRYYPQFLELSGDVHANWFLDLWALAPTPAKARRVREKSFAAILKTNRVRRVDAKAVMEVLRKPALTVAPGTVEGASAHVEMLSERIRLVNGQLKKAERRLDQLVEKLVPAEENEEEAGDGEREPCDVEILQSLPGVGRIVLATLLAEASRPLGKRDYQTLRTHSGVAPVTRRSAKSKMVVMRRASSSHMREALYHWARVASYLDPATRMKYAALRGKGHDHPRALRTVGDRLLAVACAMLRDRTVYDASRRLPAPAGKA